MREAFTSDHFRELDDLVEMLLELRADPLTCDALPRLPELAGGDPQVLALLERRLELVMARTGTKREA